MTVLKYCVLSFLSILTLQTNAQDYGPQAKEEFKVQREETFEFSQKPSVTRNGDEVGISFSVKAACDVTVAIEDSQGRILRHLATGILGPKSPHPFKSGLSQELIWDGKNDFGIYVNDIDNCIVRVSLGLKSSFEKNLHYHPLRTMGDDTAIACDKDGVYIYQANMNDYVRKFDHDGNYVKTIYPFSSDKLDEVLGLKMRSLPTGGLVPDKKRGDGNMESTVTMLPIRPALFRGYSYTLGDMVIHNGLLRLFCNEGMAHIGTDGTSMGQPFHGGPAAYEYKEKGESRRNFKRPPHKAAISPDGKYYYMTQYFWSTTNKRGGSKVSYEELPHLVTRMPTDGSEAPTPFIGDVKEGQKEGQFDIPNSIAVDPQGRIYVADWSNDRVQVFSPDGSFYASIPKIIGPAEVSVDPKSGEVYVVTWQVRTKAHNFKANQIYNRRTKQEVLKFSALGSEKASKLLQSWSIDMSSEDSKDLIFDLKGYNSRVKFDFFAGKHPRLWVVEAKGSQTKKGKTLSNRDFLVLLELREKKVVLIRDFHADVEKDGYTDDATFFQRRFLHFDPVREKLYVAEMDSNEMKNYKSMIGIDIKSGSLSMQSLPLFAADAGFDAFGRFYIRSGSNVARYNPVTWKEIPYDYGEDRENTISLIPTIGGGASSHKYGGFGVSPLGDVVVACNWRLDTENRATIEKKRTDLATKWSPKVYPGRPSGSLFVHTYNSFGEMNHEDILKGGGTFTGGLQMDLQGNVYGVLRNNRILDGKAYGNNGTGTLAKFSPGKGLLIKEDNTMAPLDKKLDRPRDVEGSWVVEADWLYGDAAVGSNTSCWCRHGQFFVDYFGRTFVCEQERFSIAVLDPNGRVITRIGHYGNVDEKSISLVHASYVTGQTDKRLFIADNGNGRVFSVKLDYQESIKIPLKGTSK